jgi:hypothetical protein
VADEWTRGTAVDGSCLGDVASRIEYALEPDVDGTGEEALASLGDMLGDGAGRFEVLF